MNDVDNRRVHGRGGDVVICPDQELTQRASQLLCIAHIDGNKLQDAVLGNHAEDMGSIGLAISGDEGGSARAGLEHAPTRFVQGPFGIDGDGFGGRDAQCLFNICPPPSHG